MWLLLLQASHWLWSFLKRLLYGFWQVGVLIGKQGETIRFLQSNSGAKIQITRDTDADPNSTTRPAELIGTLENINKAERLIKDVIAEVPDHYFVLMLLNCSYSVTCLTSYTSKKKKKSLLLIVVLWFAFDKPTFVFVGWCRGFPFPCSQGLQ